MTVLAVVTEQLVAVYPVPEAPYVADMPLLDKGPKFVPDIVISSLPPVAIVLPDTANDDTAGTVYESVADDSADTCDPTVTFHLWLAPTPAADVQVISVFAVLTEQLVAS